MVKIIVKCVVIALVLGCIFFVVFDILVISAFGFDDKTYTPNDLKASFLENKQEIYELKRYFNQIVPKTHFVEIEFSSDHELARFGIQSRNSTAADFGENMFLDWNMPTETKKMDSLIRPLGWNRQTLATLKEKLDQVDCIQIQSGEPTTIGFKRSGMGMYFFKVFDQPMPDSLKCFYDKECVYIYVNPRLVLEYGGGAIGPQCFPEKYKKQKVSAK